MTTSAVEAPVDARRIADTDKLAFVDALRGLAVLLVIWVHHSQAFDALAPIRFAASYGQMGVQLFFVASAFTLCRSAQLRSGERHATRNFYLRRIFRIAPLYWCAILGYGLLDAARRATGRAVGDSSYTAANVLLNFLFVHGLSSAAYNSVVPGGWSISTEMMFYALFPALLPAVAFTYRQLGVSGLAAWTAAAIGVSLVVQTATAAAGGPEIANNNVVYFSIANQLPVFVIGLGCALLIADGRLAPQPVRDAASFALATIAAFALLYGDQIGLAAWIGPTLGPPVAAVSFVYLLNLARAGRLPALGGLLARVGQLSYSMYVCHFLFAWAGTNIVLRTFGATPGMQALLYLPTLLLAIAGSMAVASITKRWIEDPGIALGKRLIRRLQRSA
ncbi:acyltransferase [Sphingomonas sp.]|uniref:acyltransferase family protein n=1 Tax=Sphingomonas sp. TaxID=28214 RepID=UPI002D810463|nr:acyltransferase [Sphingomonas sp.]HEU0045856.1 acyltransferase [Sphingomonas sp.]